jgi:hypothetical protein
VMWCGSVISFSLTSIFNSNDFFIDEKKPGKVCYF